MKFEEIRKHVGQVPFIHEREARYLYDLIIAQQLTQILELGFAHGTATCYMAAALDELGEGQIVSVDLVEARERFVPPIEQQLALTGLAPYVEVVRMQTGYTWFLHDDIRSATVDGACWPKYKLCIIDGPKNWTIDGLAFFLVDKLLCDGGWIIFDDYNWTYASVDNCRDVTDGITHRTLSAEEQVTPHIREVFELLVKQHPNYNELMVQPWSNWALARKCSADRKSYIVDYQVTKKDLFVSAAYRLRRILKMTVRTARSRR